MRTIMTALGFLTASSGQALAADKPLRPDQLAFRELYEELVETNTTLSSGSCSLAAERMAARLKAAGMPDNQITLFAHPDHPKEGGLVAVYPGTSKTLKPILGIAHIDVVEAKREDWARDPFTLIEENGYFYGRGTLDDKAMAATLVDTLIRFQRSAYKPKRTVKTNPAPPNSPCDARLSTPPFPATVRRSRHTSKSGRYVAGQRPNGARRLRCSGQAGSDPRCRPFSS
jgi:hypothetical protein